MLDSFPDCPANCQTVFLFFSHPALNVIRFIKNHVGQFSEMPSKLSDPFLFSKPALNMILFLENHVGQLSELPGWTTFQQVPFFAACAQRDSAHRKSCWTVSQAASTTLKSVSFFRTCAQHYSVYRKSCWTVSRTALPTFNQVPFFLHNLRST